MYTTDIEQRGQVLKNISHDSNILLSTVKEIVFDMTGVFLFSYTEYRFVKIEQHVGKIYILLYEIMLFWHSEYRTIKIEDHWSISHVLIEIGVSD